MDANQHKSSPLLLIAAWLVVSVPAAWGVTQTIDKSLDLFRAPPPAPPPAATVPAPATQGVPR